MRGSRARAAAACAVVALVSACTPVSDAARAPTPTATGDDASPAITASGSPAPAGSAGVEVTAGTAYIAQSLTPDTVVYSEPDGERLTTVRSEDVLTVPSATPLVFLVKRTGDEWLEVYLPVRPNGTTGWVRADAVTLTTTSMRVEVSLADFELQVFDGATQVFETPIGLGQDGLPTPGGVYYIRELLQPPDPTGVYGPYAYGLSGYSPVLDSFAGGDAVIGIHGTNEPDSIGQAVSHGCIRLPNDAIASLVEEVGLPLGTPVVIDAD